MPGPISICCCHSDAREDIRYRDYLEKHLSLLIRTRQITLWHPGKIQPGDVREQLTAFQIATADVILLLLSADFFSSDLCWEQMGFALIQSIQRRTCIIPILLSFFDSENSPIAHLEALPKNKKPIKKWRNKDEAIHDVVQSIQSVVAKMRTSPREKASLSDEDYKLPKIPFIPGVRSYSSEKLLRFWGYLPPFGLCISGKYRLRESASTLGEVVRHYVPLGIPGLTPVSVSIDTTDCAPKNITQPSAANLSSGGVEIFGVSTEADSLCEVAGNIIIQY
jgi:hypothetical protein